jgi:hemerythrin superfamily protein
MARQSDQRDEKTSAKSAQEKFGGNGERQQTDAIEMLKADHRRVEGLFDKYEQARRRAEKSKLAQQICLELTIHAQLEEEIFYPACREHVDDPLLDEAQVEHDTAKILITEIAMGSPTADPFFDAKVKVLGEYVHHHVEEEEKSAESIFAKAIEGGVDTAALGRRLMERREELMEQFDEELLLPQPKALHVTLAQEEEVWSEPPRRDEARRGWAARSRDAGGRRAAKAGARRGATNAPMTNAGRRAAAAARKAARASAAGMATRKDTPRPPVAAGRSARANHASRAAVRKSVAGPRKAPAAGANKGAGWATPSAIPRRPAGDGNTVAKSFQSDRQWERGEQSGAAMRLWIAASPPSSSSQLRGALTPPKKPARHSPFHPKAGAPSEVSC